MTPPLPAAPEGVAASALDWMAATGHGRLHLYEQPVMIERARPVVLGAHSGRLAGWQRRHCAPAAVVAELPDAAVIGPSGAVITSDGCVLADQIASPDRAVAGHRVWRGSSGAAQVRLGGTVAVVAAGGPGDGPRHLIADTLPRIQLVRDAGLEPDHWIVTGSSELWERQAFETVDIDPDSVHIARWDRLIRAERLIVPSRSGSAAAPAPWARERLRRALNAGSRSGRDRLLLCGTRADEHRMRAETHLADVLADYGFTAVTLEALHFQEQIERVGQAGCIVSTHRQALTHLLHAPPGGVLIEIAPAANLKSDYAAIASLAEWRHRYLPVGVTEAPDGLDFPVEELHIEPETVLAALAEVLPGGGWRSVGAGIGANAAHQPAHSSAEGHPHAPRQ
jgi:capsular polysaccharide biosynthesis protein